MRSKGGLGGGTHASPFSWLTASRPWPMLTKSRRTKLGARPAANCSQPAAFATILHSLGYVSSENLGLNGYKRDETHELTLFVVGASFGSLTMMPVPRMTVVGIAGGVGCS